MCGPILKTYTTGVGQATLCTIPMKAALGILTMSRENREVDFNMAGISPEMGIYICMVLPFHCAQSQHI